MLGDGQADPEKHRRVIDEAGVDRFVVVAIPKRSLEYTPNEFIAEYVNRYPGRAVGLASVYPDDDDSAEEFEHAVKNLGLKGLKLSPCYQEMDPRSMSCCALYEIAQHYEVPVMFHAGAAYTGSLEFGDICLLDKVGMTFPDLKIIVAHFGQPHMEQTCILMRKNENIFADLSARFHRPWQLYNGLMVAQEYGVAERLLFGSDFPVAHPGRGARGIPWHQRLGRGRHVAPYPGRSHRVDHLRAALVDAGDRARGRLAVPSPASAAELASRHP